MTHDVRTFRAASMPAALGLVRRELGPNAVILGTRTLAASGVGRLARREQVEITASPPDAPARGARLDAKPVRAAKAQMAEILSAAQAAARAKAGLRTAAAPKPASVAPAGPPALPEQVYPYFVKLVQNEVAEDLAMRVLSAAARAMPARLLADDRVVSEVLRRSIARMIPTARPIELPPGQARRIALVGPPGSGKTTTVAKLAARLKLHARKQVALVSLDMHRLAAHEQLQRYAQTLGMPMSAAQSVAEVKEALRRFSGVDCVLIDTAGVGLREQGRFARTAALLRAARPDEVHLALPACMATGAQVRTVQAFAPLGVSRVVLTHVDEILGLGVLLNVVDKVKCAVSYFTTGQNVARDIEEACSKRLAELILPVRT